MPIRTHEDSLRLLEPKQNRNGEKSMKKIICLVVLLCCLLGLSIMAYADDTDTVKTDQPHDRVITFVDPDAAEEQDSGEENAEKEKQHNRRNEKWVKWDMGMEASFIY